VLAPLLKFIQVIMGLLDIRFSISDIHSGKPVKSGALRPGFSQQAFSDVKILACG